LSAPLPPACLHQQQSRHAAIIRDCILLDVYIIDMMPANDVVKAFFRSQKTWWVTKKALLEGIRASILIYIMIV
jgi:hypothetical protein